MSSSFLENLCRFFTATSSFPQLFFSFGLLVSFISPAGGALCGSSSIVKVHPKLWWIKLWCAEHPNMFITSHLYHHIKPKLHHIFQNNSRVWIRNKLFKNVHEPEGRGAALSLCTLPLCNYKSIHSTAIKLMWHVKHPNLFTLVTITCQSWPRIARKWRYISKCQKCQNNSKLIRKLNKKSTKLQDM